MLFHSVSAEQAPSSVIQGIPFRLLLHGPGVTAVFEGEQGRPTPISERGSIRASTIEHGIRSLTFFFDGDEQGFPFLLHGEQSSPNRYWPLNIFAVEGYIILPQQTGSRHHLVGIEHLKAYVLGRRGEADKLIENLEDYLLRDDLQDHIETVPYTLKLYSADVTAVFRGSASGGFPLQAGTNTLSFIFPDSDTEFEFHPKETLYWSDWEFDLVSPDGRHVLLLQSHYGPYHIVSADHLRGYLVGDLEPDYVVGWNFPNSATEAILSDGSWWSTHRVVFNATCCGTTERLIYELGNNDGPVRSNLGN